MNSNSLVAKITVAITTVVISVPQLLSKNNEQAEHRPVTTVLVTAPTTTTTTIPAKVWLSYDPNVHVTYSEQARQVQQILKDLGYSVTVDGLYGPVTVQAVLSFQRANHLTEDGIVGPTTLKILQMSTP